MKGAQKKQHLRLDAEGRELAQAVKEFYREHANSLRPRSKAASGSEAELLKFGGRKAVIRVGESRRQTRTIFGGVGETRFIFTPYRGAWKVALDPKSSPEELPEELKRELNKSRRKLLNAAQKKADIAFQAVDALLSCSRDWQDFSALPKSKQKKADVYRAMIRVQLAILTTLQALKRDVENNGRKLQLAFELLELLTDQGWPGKIEDLRHHAVMLACELQHPPSKKELKDRCDSSLHHEGGKVRSSEFATLLKAAGLSWLKRGKRDRRLVSRR